MENNKNLNGIIKGISVANPDDIEKDYIEMTVDYAISRGYTHFQFIGPIHNYIRGNIDGMTLSKKYAQFNDERDLEYIKLNVEVVNAALEKLNKAGVKSYMWHHELDLPTDFEKAYPEILNENGDVEVSHPRVKDYLENRIKDFFDTYPKMDGIILTLHETKVPLLKLQNQKLGKIERVKYVTEILFKACKERGKELVVRPFASVPEDYDMMLNAYESISKDLVVMDKWTQFDWSLTLPHNKFFAKIKNNPLLVETDIFGEYFGKGLLPLMLKEHITQKVEYCKDHNIIGYVNRVDREGRHPFNKVNEVNLDIMYALMSGESVDKAIDDFFNREYPDCAGELKAIMEETEELNRKLLNNNNYYFSQGSFFPFLNHSKNHFYFEMMKENSQIASNEWFIPVGWERGELKEIFAEKDYVVEKANKFLAQIKELESKIAKDKYPDLLIKFNNLYYASKLWRTLLDVFYNYVKYFEFNDSKYEDAFYNSVEQLKAIDLEGKSVLGDTLNYYANNNMFATGEIQPTVEIFIKDVVASFETEKKENEQLKTKGYTDYIICGGGYESHKLQKEVNFSDTLINNEKLCRVPGSSRGSSWTRVNAHGWFSYEIKVKPNAQNVIEIEVGTLGEKIEFTVTIDGEKTKYSDQDKTKTYAINYNETKGNDSVRIRLDRISGNTPLIYSIVVK